MVNKPLSMSRFISIRFYERSSSYEPFGLLRETEILNAEDFLDGCLFLAWIWDEYNNLRSVSY